MIDMTDNAVTVRGLSRQFGDSLVLDNLDLEIAPGEFIALLGRSGSGKTTLLRALGDLDNGYTGTLKAPAGRAIAFQEARLLPWKTVRQNVGIGLTNIQQRARVEKALGEVGLAHRIDAWPATLSGGEAQRAALARALVREPALLLLDEPFASLDALTRIKMHRLVETLWQVHKPAVLLVTHDVDEAVLLADRVLVLDSGRIAIDERVEVARPRDPADPAFQRLRARLLRGLGVEIPERADERPPVQLRVIDRQEAVA
jgi:sulfonate transport system ATP-binding protein